MPLIISVFVYCKKMTEPYRIRIMNSNDSLTKWRPPSLNELTLMVFNTGLTRRPQKFQEEDRKESE